MQNDRLFFPLGQENDIDERYEELLFEDKQFFTTKALIPKVFRARLLKIKRREEAFRRIKNELPREITFAINYTSNQPTDLLQNYLTFQKDKASVLNLLFKSKECVDLIGIIELYLLRFADYLKMWQLNERGNTDEIILSKELDPTDLYLTIKAFSDAGGKNVNEIQTLFFEGKSLLLNEAKRLTLLFQNENQ